MPAQTDEAQILLQILRLIAGRAGSSYSRSGRRQHPQRLVCHGFVGGQDLRPASPRSWAAPARFPYSGCSGASTSSGAPLVYWTKPCIGAVDGGHHLPPGIKGRFAARGAWPLSSSCLVQARLAAPSSPAPHSVGSPTASPSRPAWRRCTAPWRWPAASVGAVVLHHGHLVLGQGAGLIASR